MIAPVVVIPRTGSNRMVFVDGRGVTPSHAVRKPLPIGIEEMLTAMALTEPSLGIP
jgi:hypothetical protein